MTAAAKPRSRAADPIVAMAAAQIAKGSKSFAGAARLFDADTRASAFMLYAWCRHCDDEIDGQVLGYGRQPVRRPPREVLAELRAKTLDATQGRASETIYIGLARVLQKHAIPAVHPMELIRGMEMDVEMEAGFIDGPAFRRYVTRDDTLAYCYHVAGVVGVMMAMVMGAREPAVLLRASDLGIAFQLTNIARDIVADAEVGRVYLPDAWLQNVNLTAAGLAASGNRGALTSVAQRLLTEADRYYASAEAGLPHLPFRSAWAVAAARRVYRDIGTLIRARGSNAWDARVSTSKARKLGGVALAAGDAARARTFGAASTPRVDLWTPPSLQRPALNA